MPGDNVEKPVALGSLTFFANEGKGSAGHLGVAEAIELSHSVALARDLVNAPANALSPRALADAAEAIAAAHPGTMRCAVLEEAEIRRRGMGAFLAVAQGAAPGDGSPRFIHLTYTAPAGGAPLRKVCLVGKGICFDSGGYNLKAGAGSMIELMKFDMGGAASVLGCADALGRLEPEGVEVHVLVAACENMVSASAYRPGDVLTASNGKTIEVVNTDAEGRLTLADALVFAEALKPDAIVDVATLTGACIVGLGDKIAGLWSDDDGLAEQLLGSADRAGERAWRMPLASAEYNDLTKSKIADLTNCGPRAGGAITAALFLREFVSEATPWAHLDIAGPTWSDTTGATGFGVKLLTDFVRAQGSREA